MKGWKWSDDRNFKDHPVHTCILTQEQHILKYHLTGSRDCECQCGEEGVGV